VKLQARHLGLPSQGASLVRAFWLRFEACSRQPRNMDTKRRRREEWGAWVAQRGGLGYGALHRLPVRVGGPCLIGRRSGAAESRYQQSASNCDVGCAWIQPAQFRRGCWPLACAQGRGLRRDRGRTHPFPGPAGGGTTPPPRLERPLGPSPLSIVRGPLLGPPRPVPRLPALLTPGPSPLNLPPYPRLPLQAAASARTSSSQKKPSDARRRKAKTS